MTTNEAAGLKRNVALFDQVADAIETHPELYDQNHYGAPSAFGTKHCVAGWVAELTGCTPIRVWTWHQVWDEVYKRDGMRVRLENYARQQLGLTWSESWRLQDNREGLFSRDWKPPEGETVPEALRRIGRGGEI